MMGLAVKGRVLNAQQTTKRTRKPRKRRADRFAPEQRRRADAVGVVLIFTAIFAGLVLVAWHRQSGLYLRFGSAGDAVGRALMGALGMTSLFVPPLLLVLAVRRFESDPAPLRRGVRLCLALCWIAMAGLLHVMDGQGHNMLAPQLALLGGTLGWMVATPVLKILAPSGATWLLSAVFCTATVYAFGPEVRRLERPLAWVGVSVLRLLIGCVNGLLWLGGAFTRAGSNVARRAEALVDQWKQSLESVPAGAGETTGLVPLDLAPRIEPGRPGTGSYAMAGFPRIERSPLGSAALPLSAYDELDDGGEDAELPSETLASVVATLGAHKPTLAELLETHPVRTPVAEGQAVDASIATPPDPDVADDVPPAAASPASNVVVLHPHETASPAWSDEPEPDPRAVESEHDEVSEEDGSRWSSIGRLFERAFGIDVHSVPEESEADEDDSEADEEDSEADSEADDEADHEDSELEPEDEDGADGDLVSEIAAFEKSDTSDRPANRGAPELADTGDVEVVEDPVDDGEAVAEDDSEAEDVEPAYAPAGVRYELPGLDLLEEPVHEDHRVLEDELRENSRLLLAKLGDFGVQGAITCIRPGPVITRYELEPAPGIKITKIIGLADDLALALKAIASPRVAPIPKSAALGIELPNHHRETVHFKSIVSSDGYKQNPSLLRLALGVDIAGHPYVADLARMPHLLIAGATGSGKSVCINTLLLSLLMNATPQQLQLLLIDPKMLELSIYNDVPHLLEDVVTEPKKAATALGWAVREMEERYKKLSRRRVRSISQYNELVEREPRAEPTTRDPDPAVEYALPYIVIIIDELADLMMVSGNEVETSITRLAQMARAAGIHLVLATQRPSVDVITGSIKANFPCRISFKVASKVDSRTVLDGNGAEKLLGRGDMFFIAPGTSSPVRIHGCYLSEEDIVRVVEHWKPQPPLDRRAKSIFEAPIESGADQDFAQQDDLYEQAVRFIVESGHASISLLQRRLRVGHARAARLIDMMEQDGVVGPFEGSKPREVLWKLEQLPDTYGEQGA